MKRLFFPLVAIEAVIIVIIAYGVFLKTNDREFFVNPIKKESIVFSPSATLKYFYEPKAGGLDDEAPNASEKVKYTINKDTLNERYDYPVAKKEKTYRIITIGDSYTYGLYVDTKNNWTEVLEDELNHYDCPGIDKFEVINLGVHGYDTRYEVERYRKRGEKYNPDMVVWMFVDLLRDDEKLIPLSENYEKNFKNAKDPYLAWRTARKEIRDRVGVAGILEYQKKSLQLFNRYYSGPMVIVPSWRIENNSPEDKLLKEFSKDRKNTFITDRLQGIGYDGLVFPRDPHPNLKGHRYIAESIFRYLSSAVLQCGNGNQAAHKPE